jgi:flagellar hook-associated protein 1 FlgK
MSLFSSIQVASGALQTNDIALQVVGQNISNANTEGYCREKVKLSPGTTQRVGNLNLGTGVNVSSVTRVVSEALEERLRDANSDAASADSQATTYKELESVLDSLGDTSIDTLMTNFTSSISDILNSPEDTATRNLAVLQGEQLASTISYVAQQVNTMRSDLDTEVANIADNINRLSSEIAELNQQIAAVEGGVVGASDAVGLRDQRQELLSELSDLVDVDCSEQNSGAVNVYCGDTYLVYGSTYRAVEVVYEKVDGDTIAEVQMADSHAKLSTSSGELAGVVAARDDILGSFAKSLDDYTGTLINEFNKVYSSGQGLEGYSSLTSTNSVDSADKALDDAGLNFTPTNGTFKVLVYDTIAKTTTTTTIDVNLSGVGQETTLNSLAAALNEVTGIKATASSTGELTIETLNSKSQFSFSSDSSGVLAALGLNTFFTGSTALDIGVNEVVQDNPGTFAASTEGIGSDTTNATTLADINNVALKSKDGKTLSYLYDKMISDVTQASSVAQSSASAAGTFQSTLQAQETSISGVNIDEEAVSMMAYQTAYQACAKYITALNELFDTLLSM